MTVDARTDGAENPEIRAPRRALVLISRLPYPLDDGWKVRTFHIVRELVARVPATVIVFHAGEDQLGREFARALGSTADVRFVAPPRANTPFKLLLGLITRSPFYVWNLRDVAFDRAIADALAEQPHDFGLAVYSYMFPYFERAKFAGRTAIDTHNIDSVLMTRYVKHLEGLPRRAYAWLTARKLEQFEDRVFDHADEVWVCSNDELRQLRQRKVKALVRAVPNGVDTRQLSVGDATDGSVAGRLLFFGKLDYFPNVDALRFLATDIVPKLRREAPHAVVHVVGRGASDESVALCAPESGMTLIGPVENVGKELALAEIVIVPLRVGGGTRLKILEALAAGRAVVTTRIGAEGLEVADGVHVLLADRADDIVAAIRRLLGDSTLRRSLGEAGRRLVRERYDWGQIGRLMLVGELENGPGASVDTFAHTDNA